MAQVITKEKLRELFDLLESWPPRVAEPAFFGTRRQYLEFRCDLWLWICEDQEDRWLSWLLWVGLCAQYCVEEGPWEEVEYTIKLEF